MMQVKFFCSTTILLLLAVFSAWAQPRTRTFALQSDTLYIDSLSIDPSSFEAFALKKPLNPQTYSLNPANAMLVFNKNNRPKSDSIMVKYRVFNTNLARIFTTNGFKNLPPNEPTIYNEPAAKDPKTNEIFDFEGLNKNGSISRGISFGNSQDLSINSGFNLQFSGKLGNDLELNASMTDNNLPFQPDGYTQTIQDFDRVFVQVKNPRNQITLGDYTLQRPDAYFLKMFKNVQGIESQNLLLDKKDAYKLSQTLSVSAARGKFIRNVFFGKEANQGPYRLVGEQAQAFVVVLAGSEKVYLDGNLLKRGEQYDYIMDYNTAEITFTPKHIVTGQARFVIEFEYANQAFLRSAALYKLAFEAKKVRVNFHSYTETDLSNQPLQQDLSVGQRKFLSEAGSNTQNAYFPSADTASFDAKKVQYAQLDSAGFRFYRLAQASSSQVYKVLFTFLGEGKGNYVQAPSTSNGRVFNWVKPLISAQNDTIKQGSYEPVVLLVAPNKQQMHTISTVVDISKNTNFTSELALTNFDTNKLSVLNNDKNMGYGARFQLSNQHSLGIKSQKISIKTQLNYEFLNQNFNALQPHREAEFARNWNLKQIYSQKNEHLAAISVNISDKFNNNLGLQLSNFIIGDDYTALKNKATGLYAKNGFSTNFLNDFTSFTFERFRSNFLKQSFSLQKSMPLAVVGASASQERNAVLGANNDTLTDNSFYFRIAEVFLASPDTAQNKFVLKYNIRQDFWAKNTQFNSLQVAQNFTVNSTLTKNPNHNLELSTSYRIVSDTSQNGLKQSYLGQVEYRGKWLKKLVATSFFYSFGNGQEPVRDFTFLRVSSGIGSYTWRDFNGNNIPELNEYVQAFFGDSANYVKVFLPGNKYVQTYGNRYNHSINVVLANVLKQKDKLGKFAARFSVLSTFSIDKKTQNALPKIYLNPFTLFRDSALVRSNSQVRNTLFFNRNNPVFGAELQLQNTLNRLLTTNGFSQRSNQNWSLKTRYNINQKFSLETNSSKVKRAQDSQIFKQNDFEISGFRLEPSLIYMYKNKFRLATTYNFTKEKNTLNAGNELAKTHKITLETNWSATASTLVRASLSWVQISYSGAPNTAVAYDLLQGLQVGGNQVWSLNLLHTLPNNIQIGLGYDGRKSINSPVIQSAKVQARYVF